MAISEEQRDEWKQAVVDEITQEELVEVCCGLQQFRSFSGQEREAAEYYGDWLKRQGFEVTMPEAEPDRPSAVGILRGDDSGPSLMFNGHLDIDPIEVSWGHRDPWACEIDGSRLYGHGLANMKAGDAAMAVAAAALRRVGVPLKGDVIVAGVVGEIQGGVGTTHLIQEGLVPDYAIVPEPTWLNVRTVHAGWWEFLIHVGGMSGWIGTMDLRKTVNAIDQMRVVLNSLADVKFTFDPRPDLPGLPRMIVGGIVGGRGDEYEMWRPGYVPDRCSVICDIRLVPGQSIEQAVQDIDAHLRTVAKSHPDLDFQIELPPATYGSPWHANKHGIPALDTPITDPLPRITYRNHISVLDREPEHVGAVLPNSYAGADSGHLHEAGARVINYGPSGPSGLNVSFVELENLVACSKVHAVTAIDICTRTQDEVDALGASISLG